MTASPVVPRAYGELERIFTAHHARVFRAAYRISGNADDAEDALQTVFLRLLRQGWETSAVGHLESYLCRAAVNAALDQVRARQRSRSVPLEEAALAPDGGIGPDRAHESRELGARLRRELARLTPKAAEIFALRYFEGYPNRDIARMLGTSQLEVAVSLHRSRSRLQKQVRSYRGDQS